jgi:hypothetical protein
MPATPEAAKSQDVKEAMEGRLTVNHQQRKYYEHGGGNSRRKNGSDSGGQRVLCQQTLEEREIMGNIWSARNS